MTKQEFLNIIPGLKKISPIFSQVTKMPMVFCHEETMDDYIYVYLEEMDALTKAKVLNDERMPAVVVNCKEKEVLPFLAELRLTGVNAVCFVTPKVQGGEEFLVQISEFLKLPDWNSLPVEKRPLENMSLHLSMLYFMQEMRRPVEQDAKKNLTELEEETSANITRARFMIPVQEGSEGENKGKKGIMLLKNDKEEMLIPLFTDGGEMRKFMKGKPCPVAIVDFRAVADMIVKGNGAGIVINPASCNIVLNKMGVLSLVKRFLV